MFIKPHAAGCVAVQALCEQKLAAAEIRIEASGDISAAEIDKEGLFDEHFGPT
jgi:hypothetical protein